MNDTFEILGILKNYKGRDVQVILPDVVSVINDGAFENSDVKVVDLRSVKEIKANAFKNCKSLEKVILKDVEVIENDAFLGCDALRTVEYLGSLQNWCEIDFKGFTANPLYYAKNLFIDGKQIKELTLDVKTVKNYAFCGLCIDELTLLNVQEIGVGAFSDCKGFKDLVLPSTLKKVGELAFRGSSMETLTMHKDLTVESWAFFNCLSLKKVIFQAKMQDWLNLRFRDVWANPLSNANALYVDGEKINVLSIPQGVKVIPQACFAGLDVKEVILNDANIIEDVAFYGCKNLENIVGVPEKIGDSAFAECPKLDKTIFEK